MLSFEALFQLYAPLAGLLGVVFWLGVLSNRVRSLEDEAKEAKKELKSGSSTSERIVRLETKMDDVKADLESINRGMSGVQRQLSNLATKTLKDLSE